jgi:tRNA pseudouridine synthase 10
MLESLAIDVLKRGFTCNNCLGRQFAQLATGLTNHERGSIVRTLIQRRKPTLRTKAQRAFARFLEVPKTNQPFPTQGRCVVCDNLFDRLEKLALQAVKNLRGTQYSTFVLGTHLNPPMIKKEEALWEDVGILHCEPIKAEINRELGKLIEKKTRKLVDENNPDVTILFDMEKNDMLITRNPLFFSGNYKKLVRGIPQTKWEHYKETVEDIVARPVMRATKGSGHAFHAAGREDIDARCLDWRPFVLEIQEPKKRDLNLRVLSKEVNSTRKVRITTLRRCIRKEILRIKNLRPDKTYQITVLFKKTLTNLEAVAHLKGLINQKTPERVLHRRSDKLRKRRVKHISWKKLGKKRVQFEIRGEAGLYIKELITGDKGRTTPSVAELLNAQPTVENLDVVKIHLR